MNAPEIKNPETTAEKTFNRRCNREMSAATEYLQELLQAYIEFKNKNFAEKDGYLIHAEEVKYKYSDLNFQWNDFVRRNNLKKSKLVNFGTHAFVDQVKKHNAAHSKLCWINYMMMILKAKYSIEPNAGRLADIYREDYLPQDAIIDIICSHQLNLNY